MHRQIASLLMVSTLSVAVIQLPCICQFVEAKSFDSTGLSSSKASATAVESKIPNKPSIEAKNAVKKLFTMEELQIKKIETQIKAINLIIKTEKNKEKKNELFLRRAQMQLGIARSLGVKRTTVAQMTPIEKEYLQSAKKTLSGLQQLVTGKNKKMADIHYLLGLIDYEYDDTEAVKKNFYQALTYSPQHTFATSMAIVLGELEYDQERFKEAIQIYQKFYKQYSPKERALADYKTAWSYVGFHDDENARKYFLRIIVNKGDPDFVTDAIKDLAYLAVLEMDEAQIIQYGTQNLRDEHSRGLFFYHAINQFLAKDKKIKRENLFAEIQKLAMDPVQRARVLYLKVQFERSEVPTLSSYHAMLGLNQHLTTLKASDLSQFLLQDGLKLEDDSEAIIKNFIDAYSGKLQKPDNLPQTKIIESAKDLIAIHLRVFPQSNKKEIIYSLWMDACAETKDDTTLEYLKNLFYVQRKKTPYDTLYNQAFLKQIILIDEAYIKNPNANSAKLTELTLRFLKEFPKHPENLKIRKKLAAIYIKEEKYKEALPFLEQIQKDEPQAENLNRLLYVKFKLNLYQEVINNDQTAQYSNPEIQDLMRESSLKLAQKSLDDGSFADYELHIKKFLLSSPSDEKATVAYQDYFQRILSQQKLSVFLDEWAKMKTSLQSKKEFYDVRRKAILLSLTLAQNIHDQSLLRLSQNAELDYAIHLYQFGFSTMDTTSLRRIQAEIPEDKKNYLLKYSTYIYPQITLDYLSSQKDLNSEEKSFLFDAILITAKMDFADFIESNKLHVFLQSKQYALVKEFIPASVLPKAKSKILEQIKTYRVPTAETSPNRYSKMIEALARDLRYLRTRVPKELQKISSGEQILVLSELSSLEKRTAEAILKSPAPAKLTSEQQAEYQQGIEELASEFEKQSAEYSTTNEGIKQKREADKLTLRKNDLLIRDTDDLLKPANKELLVNAIKVSKQYPMLALLQADLLLAQNKLSVKDHDLIKLHLLFNHNSSAPMGGLLGRDLVLQKKEELLIEINAKAKP